MSEDSRMFISQQGVGGATILSPSFHRWMVEGVKDLWLVAASLHQSNMKGRVALGA